MDYAQNPLGDKSLAQLKQSWTDYVDVEQRKGAQGIVRTAALLRILASYNDAGLRLTDIAEIASLEQSTSHRVLTALDAVGFVTKHPETRRYHLGPLLLELHTAAYRDFSVRDAVFPAMTSLATELGDTVYLTVRSGLDAICIERVEGSSPIRTCTVDVGVRRPLGIGAGSIALLASFPSVERDLIIGQNRDRYIELGTDEQRIQENCSTFLEQGYFHGPVLAYSAIKSTAVSISGYSGRPIAGLSTSGLASSYDEKHLQKSISMLRTACEDLTSQDGALSDLP